MASRSEDLNGIFEINAFASSGRMPFKSSEAGRLKWHFGKVAFASSGRMPLKSSGKREGGAWFRYAAARPYVPVSPRPLDALPLAGLGWAGLGWAGLGWSQKS